ncbi:hypothetical protein [Paraburkholderia sp. MM5482-R1]|uniref:hypothetical protein n=1 Tax=unclassified Paraburkholderia TaxID=2615204 RepID=UPI003D1BFD5C
MPPTKPAYGRLNYEDAARILTTIGALYPLSLGADSAGSQIAGGTPDARGLAGPEDGIELTIELRNIRRYVSDCLSRESAIPFLSRQEEKSSWLKRWQELFPVSPSDIRYCLRPGDSLLSSDVNSALLRITDILHNTSTKCRGIHWELEVDQARRFEWCWPPRVAVATGKATEHLRPELERCATRHLIELVDFTNNNDTCDIIIFPSDFSDALSFTKRVYPGMANVLLVIGEDSSAWSAQPWGLSILLRHFGAAALAICNVPVGRREAWLDQVLRESSHDSTLDVALYAATKHTSIQVVLGFTQFLDAARFSLSKTPISVQPATALRPDSSSKSIYVSPPEKKRGDDNETPLYISPLFAIRTIVEHDFWSEDRFHSRYPVPPVATSASSRAEHSSRTAASSPATASSVPAVPLPRTMPSRPRPPNPSEDWPFPTGSRPPANEAPQAAPRGGTGSLLGSIAATGLHVIGIGAKATIHLGSKTVDGLKRAKKALTGETASVEMKTDGIKIDTFGLSSEEARAIVLATLEETEEPEPPRFVLLEVSESVSDDWQVTDFLIWPSRFYRANLFIGPARAGALAADEPFNEEALPPADLTYHLTVVFIPLWKDAQGARPPTQTQTIELPRTGDSTSATFDFWTPATLISSMGRVVFLHENRVLQTLLITAGLLDDASGRVTLVVESVVSKDFGEQTLAPAFEAALVVSDSSDDGPSLTAITPGSASFFVPEGLGVIISDIRKELGALNAQSDDTAEPFSGLDDGRIRDLLYALAMRGAGMAKELARQKQLGPFLAAPRIQVIEAASGTYFPLEFIYDGPAPAPGAIRCEHALDALLDFSIHPNCPNRRGADRICPAAFWGFSRCVERQPSDGRPGYQLSQPQAGQDSLQPLNNALLAASTRVRQLDLEAPDGVTSILTGAGVAVARAASWEDWKAKISSESPSLLVLLPHSLESMRVAHLPALEISGDYIESVRLDEGYVRSGSTGAPVVLLLGCSTTLPEVPFLNFVREFRFNGAAVTIGTLATIRGRQTVEFIRELLVELKAVATEERTFDEVLLLVKRRMLAKGNPLVLSLVAYGDTGWKVRP